MGRRIWHTEKTEKQEEAMGREPKAAEIERQTGHGDGKINLEHGERKKDKGEVLFSLREPGHWTQITANEHQTISVSGEQDLSRKVAFFMTGRNIPVPAQFSTVFLQKYSSTCSIFHSFLTEIFQYLLNFSQFSCRNIPVPAQFFTVF